MARPSNLGERAPRQREKLGRKRVRYECQLQPDRYEKLHRLRRIGPDGKPEPLVAVIERLIQGVEETASLPFRFS